MEAASLDLPAHKKQIKACTAWRRPRGAGSGWLRRFAQTLSEGFEQSGQTIGRSLPDV